MSERLRALPSVERVATALDAPHALAVDAARAAVAAARQAALGGDRTELDVLADARARLAAAERPTLRRVLNATGVIVHTNLGRAPLPAAARAAAAATASGYANLEYDLGTGRRGSRLAHVEELLCALTGAEAALAVNNGAAAVLLAAAALAGPGREVVVSRGQLVEIGGSFRIPDVIAQSGARLVEVGTTNRTRLRDYERALGERTGAILRAHQSNFATVGFVEAVEIEPLAALVPPVIDDVGSGRLDDGLPLLADEPSVRRSVAAGAAIVCCSGDKLLGGPQAGLMIGRRDAIAAAREHPLARAVRIDKLSLAALAATLRLYRDPERARREVPVLAMLDADPAVLRARAERLAAAFAGEVVQATAKVGGGALPLLELAGPVARIPDPAPDRLAARLRAGEPPIVGRIADGALLLDPRTLTDDEVELACRR
ncbi:MAG TPA: L-seryl-tRNA(Sec) selenium transferase [Solirubrobacteraceae bacterium]|nr:L-seryl-tRNA(Sec) selenium transferase [Solirubrobacteraceae bacterium]